MTTDVGRLLFGSSILEHGPHLIITIGLGELPDRSLLAGRKRTVAELVLAPVGSAVWLDVQLPNSGFAAIFDLDLRIERRLSPCRREHKREKWRARRPAAQS